MNPGNRVLVGVSFIITIVSFYVPYTWAQETTPSSAATVPGNDSPLTLSADVSALVESALEFLVQAHREFWLGLLVSLCLAAGCWIAASYYSHLWNLRFRVTLTHHMLCLLAALCTLIFGILFFGLKYTGQAANTVIDGWRTQLVADRAWQQVAFRDAYRAVKALGLEDFSSYPPPEQGGRLIPMNQPESRKKSAEIYANAAIQDFHWRHPFLSKILKVRPDIPSTLVNRDVKDFFDTHPGETYPMVRAINIATAETRKNLQIQTARIVPITRTMLVILFLLVQLIPFGIIGYAAYTDLKVTT